DIQTELLPTPLKFHYTFNLRELSRLLQGLLQSSPERFKGPKKFLRLWRHECLRVFRDRMVDEEDVATINNIILSHMNNAFSDEVNYASMDPILFGDYWAVASEQDPRLYEDMQDYEVCKAIVEELLYNYRKTEGNMEMVLFNDALEHLGAIHRILRLDGGHALLVGVSGSGKKCLAKLAAYITNVKTFEIVLHRGYHEAEFREDLKTLYTNMSTNKDDHMFLVCEELIRDESFLELINNMLTTGFVSALFCEEEKDTIQENLWPEAEAAIRAEAIASGNMNALINKETVWNYFRSSCASRLHLVLCMNPTGDTLRTRCRDFPGIAKCTTIDWYFPWPEQALYAVACSLIDPKFSYSILSSPTFDSENIAQKKRLQGGLEKLRETAIQIEQLNVKLAVQKVVLEEKTSSCEMLMAEINEATVVATTKKTQAQEKSAELAKQAKIIVAEKDEAEAALAEALPTVEAARNALDELEKNDVTEIRAFATPPKPVQMVGEALCHILQASEISWKAARGLMADANFISILQQMDVEAIPLKNIQNLKDLIAKRKMTYDDVRLASKAGGGFYKFVLAVITFHDVAREVRPKRERVKALEREYNKAKRDLQKLTDEVAQLEETLFSLRRQFDSAQTEMENLKKEMDVMRRQLMVAQKLTAGLGSEKERWIQELANLGSEQKCLLGSSLVASAFLCYLGPFTFEFRERLLYEEWLSSIIHDGIPVTDNLRVNTLLATEVEVALWNSQGLPSDELSTQNAILVTKGPTCPVCIDPQGQASRWLKEMGKNLKDEPRSIRITTQNDPNFLRTVENAIKLGLACLIEGVEESLDPALNNIIARNTRVDKGREIVMLGDREVEYDPNFRLYLVTKLSNPHFSATLYSRALIINYTVTLTGLEDHENKRVLKELEDRLLLELATQTGNILDNWELIGTLEDAKNKAVDVSKQLAQGAVVAKDVERQRDSFRPAARRGAILFFVLADLSMVGPMYQFSLSAYLTVFLKALKKAMPHSSLPKRLSNIKNALTYATYCYGCMGIFEEHKMLLSFELAIRLQQDEKLIRPKELAFLVRGNVALAEHSHPPPYPWIPETVWRDLVYLSAFIPRRFGKLIKDIRTMGDQWKKWFEAKNPEVLPYPGRYKKLRPFVRLCLIRCWRIDRIPSAITHYVVKVLGKQYVEPPITNLADVLPATSPTIPIVLIVQPGSDPQSQLANLAQQMELGHSGIKYLSMGQGQE
ncbi:dynein heavy chain, axonemal, partial [Paragonimus westermani]